MDIRKLQRAIVDGLEDVKAQDIAVFNTEHLSPLFERVILATGSSNRQTKALASSVRKAVRSAGFQIMRTEGEDNGEWIIVDCAAAVVHIMQPTIRQYYQLEEIWGDKPVALKMKAVRTGLVKASEPMDDDAGKAVGKKSTKATAKKTAARKSPGTKAEVQKAALGKAPGKAPGKRSDAKAPAARPVAVKKAAAKKAAGKVAARKTPARKSVAPVKTIKVNVPVAKKAAAKKTVARPVVRKVAAKKVAAKKVAAKKAPARKSAR